MARNYDLGIPVCVGNKKCNTGHFETKLAVLHNRQFKILLTHGFVRPEKLVLQSFFCVTED